MLNSSLSGMVTALLLVFLIDEIIVKGGFYTLKKAAKQLSSMLNKGKMTVIICNDIIAEIKRTGFDRLNQPLLTIETKWIPASFTVSKAIRLVIIITFGLKNSINKAGNSVANLNPDRNQTGAHNLQGGMVSSIAINQITHTGKLKFCQLSQPFL